MTTTNPPAQSSTLHQSTFLTMEAVAMLTGRRRKSKQVEALRMMGLPFWVNPIGQPIVTVAAVEGRREPTREKEWVMPRKKDGPKKHA
ncbi:MAG: DUF4224 domain-containing protein [Pseudomonadota bacterium]|nr:DUF4224 domain-containing protein [Pseudomonadota bacterium]